MNTKALLSSAILMCVVCSLTAQTGYSEREINKHLSVEDSLFYESLSDSIYPSRSGITGDTRQNPIQAGSYSASFCYSDTQNTASSFTHQYGRNTSDVFYRLVLTVPMNVTFTHEGSVVSNTYMHLLDSNGNLIVSNGYYAGEGHCTSTSNSFIRRQLAAGTYYVVSEGYSINGQITTNITGFASTDYGYSSIPSAYSTEPDVSVGAMGGAFSVSPMGGATYTIPIEVPQGVNGLQPHLSIVYNSQAGNGICGYGASLAGLSSITRGPKDIYHDGLARGINYQADDALYLDGVRLILSSGTPGQDGTVYIPESDPFTRVIAHGNCTATSDNTWFEVQRSDGTVNWYGCSIQSRHSYDYDENIQKILSWYIERVIQPTGNFIDYSYDIIDNYVYLAFVSYGRNQNNLYGSNFSYLQFDYETSNGIPVYFDNQHGQLAKRLKKITSLTGDSIFRSYTLNYNNTSDGTNYKYSRLISVTEKNGRNESLPVTQFNWSYLPSVSYQSSNLSVSNPSTPNNVSLPFGDQIYVSGDLNNDGMDDIAGLTTGVTVNGQNKSYLYINWAHRTSSGINFPSGISFEMPDVFDRSIYMDRDMGDFHSFFNGSAIADWDGDGYNEIFLPYYETVSGTEYMKFYIQGCNSTGQSCWNEVVSCPLYTSNGSLYSIADLNNDGRNDIFVLEKSQSGGSYYCHLLSYDLSLPGTYNCVNFQLSLSSAPKHVYLSDMNNNGIKDVLVICNNGYAVFWNQGGVSLSSSMFSDSYKVVGTNLQYCSMTTAGDFNGDGLLDILTNATNSTAWYYNLNQGDGTFFSTLACVLPAYDQGFTDYDNDKFHCDVFDFDGDGRTDVVVTKAIYSSSSFYNTSSYWMRSVGSALEQIYYASSNSENDALSNRFASGDFNGDGLKELVTYGYDCVNGDAVNTSPVWRLFKHNNYSEQSGKVISMTGDFGKTIEVSYSTLSNQSVYSLGAADVYPAPVYTNPLNVVRTVVQDNGAAGSIATAYSYSGLKVHLCGKGVLGFCSTTAENMTQGTTMTSRVMGWDSSFYIPVSTKVKTTAGSDSTVSVTTLTVVNKGAKKYFAYPSQTVSTDYDGRTVTTACTYDTIYGYPLSETVTYGTNMYRSVSYSNYTLAGGTYHPQTVVTSQRHPDDNTPFNNTVTYTYNSGTGTIASQVEFANSTKRKTTSYTYDDFGNITSKSVKPFQILSLITYYSYDSSNRYPVRIYNNRSQVVQKYTYDMFGDVLTEQDSINSSITNTVTHTYDGWGNLIRTQTPGYGEVTYTRGWNNSSDKRYFILSQGPSRPWVKTWYDNQGREVMVESVGVNDITVSTATEYNLKGLKSSVTETTGNLTLESNYSYDSRGRLVSEYHSGNSSITYQYGTSSSGRTETVNDNGRQTVYTYDAMDNLKQVQGPTTSNLVTYNYSSNGGIKSAVAAGSTWTFGYDFRGYRTSLTDPDAGTTTYTYDALGREKTRTDARGVVFTTNYNSLNRVTSEIVSQSDNTETIGYSYGTSGTGQSRLVRKTLGSWTNSYEYDQYGRLTTENEGGHTVLFEYNSSGLVSRMTWPNGNDLSHYVDYTYDSYGNCISQSAISGAMVWNLTGYTGTSSTSTMSLQSNPNPFTRTTTYDSYGNLSSSTLVRNSTTLSSASYTFNAATGNLTSRTLGGNTQTFTYDNLDRLTEISSNNQSIMSMTYNANGNISSKTGIGDYEYNNSSKPHAVTAVSDTSNLIIADAQSVTYNIWGKVSEVNVTSGSDTYKYELTYGPDLQRVLAVLWKNDQLVHLVTYGRNYEEKYLTTHIKRYYYITGSDGNSAVFADDTDDPDVAYCIDKDHLGSVIGLYDQYGTKCYGASFDAWGLRTVESGSIEYDRGFTGHEHIDEIGLIDMNGRVYDPYIGRFLSPDAFVQSPTNPQNFNRYSYCLNNPLKYTDPDGNFFLETFFVAVIDFIETAFFKGGLDITSSGAMEDAWEDFDPTASWSKTNKSWNMSLGFYKTDSDKSFWERAWEIASRFTWQSPQSFLGSTVNQVHNIFGGVKSVSFYGGATVVESYAKDWGAFTLGNYINGSCYYVTRNGSSLVEHGIKADPGNSLFQHEYGHYLQSQSHGLNYLLIDAMPSLLSTKLSGDHRKFSIEMDANRRAFKYFTECNDGYSHMGKDENGNSVWMSSEWDWGNNPLDKDFNHYFQLY